MATFRPKHRAASPEPTCPRAKICIVSKPQLKVTYLPPFNHGRERADCPRKDRGHWDPCFDVFLPPRQRLLHDECIAVDRSAGAALDDNFLTRRLHFRFDVFHNLGVECSVRIVILWSDSCLKQSMDHILAQHPAKGFRSEPPYLKSYCPPLYEGVGVVPAGGHAPITVLVPGGL